MKLTQFGREWLAKLLAEGKLVCYSGETPIVSFQLKKSEHGVFHPLDGVVYAKGIVTNTIAYDRFGNEVAVDINLGLPDRPLETNELIRINHLELGV